MLSRPLDRSGVPNKVIQIDGGNVLAAYSYLGAAIKHFEIGREEMLSGVVGRVCYIPAGQLGELVTCSLMIGSAARQIGLVASSAACRRFHDFIAEGPAKRAGQMSDNDIGQLIAFGSQMLTVFSDELSGQRLFALPSKHAAHFTEEFPFGPAVNEAFPSTEYDIVEAARCRALGRWTATVMHLMRVLEVGLAVLADYYGVERSDNWNKVLNEIEAKSRLVKKSVDGSAAEQWAAEAGTHLRFVKNAWRNHAMHHLEKYDEERAVTIYDNARSFMQHLARSLSE